MNFTAITSIGSYTKQLGMKLRWQQKKSTGDFTADGAKSLSQWIETQKKQADEPDDISRQKKKQKLTSICNKFYAGGKLTVEEKKYLQQEDPLTYQKVKSIEAEQASFERELRKCKTKEEVQRVKMAHVGSSLSAVSFIRNNPNIPKGKTVELVMAEHLKMKALEKTAQKFVEKGEYAKLPTEAERRKVEKDLAEAKEIEQTSNKDREIEQTTLEENVGGKTELQESHLAETQRDCSASMEAEAVQKTENTDRKAGGTTQRDPDEIGRQKMTRIKAEHTPEARKVRRSKAKAAYLQNSSDELAAILSSITASKLERRA